MPDSQHETPPVVLDTNVLVAGACRHEGSPAYQVVLAILRGRVPLMLSESIALEYLDVLQRPRILGLTGLSHQESAELVTELISRSYEVQLHFSWRPNLIDEGDNKFIEAAVHSGAIIVTYNRRDFITGDLPPLGWSIMNPHEFMTRYL